MRQEMPGTACTSGKVVEHSAWNRRLFVHSAFSPKGSLHAQPQEPRCFTFYWEHVPQLPNQSFSVIWGFGWYLQQLNKERVTQCFYDFSDSKVYGANMGPTWVLSAPDGPHVGFMNLAIRVRIVTLGRLRNCPWHCIQLANDAIMFMPLLHSYW